MVVTISIGEAIVVYFGFKDVGAKQIALMATAFFMQFVVLYYFRVALSEYKSVKAQLLQIDLRRGLCMFIRGYADFSAGMKGKDAAGLDKFESLIFSGLVANEDRIPSTFDGMDGLIKVAEAIGKR